MTLRYAFDGTGNATQNFWRSAENMAVTPSVGSDRWAVAQAGRSAGEDTMHVADVDGVRIDGLLFDAGTASTGGATVSNTTPVNVTSYP